MATDYEIEAAEHPGKVKLYCSRCDTWTWRTGEEQEDHYVQVHGDDRDSFPWRKKADGTPIVLHPQAGATEPFDEETP